MKVPFNDLLAHHNSLQPELGAVIEKVMQECAFIGNMNNKFVKQFEADFAAFSGAKHCIACGNGTDSLEILLKAFGIGPGDEVIVPAVSWIATSEAVSNIGASPVFADVHATEYTIDPAQIAKKLTTRTKAIIPVHLYGLPADMDPILEIARARNLIVIEDCAQAHASTYKGRKIGTMGQAGSFSFFPGKNLGALGDAGGMITNDDAIAEKARMIAQHGQSNVKHDHKIEGRNSRMDGIHAAVLALKLKRLEEWTEKRRSLGAVYRKALEGRGIQIQATPAERRHVYHLFTVQVEDRENVMNNLQAAGISTAIQYPKALPLLTAYKHLGHEASDFPVAYELTKKVVSMPIYPEMDPSVIPAVVEKLVEITGKK